MKKRTKILISLLISLLVITLVGLAGGSFYFYDVAIKRSKKDFLIKYTKDLEANIKLQEETDAKKALNATKEIKPCWVDRVGYETWYITTEDGLRLTGYFIPAKKATTKTVILAHGYSANGKDMGSFAKFYYKKLGFNVLMPDDRGHGESEGDYIGFGWPDRKDYLLWINEVTKYVGEDAQIALHGLSMGGATVMMVSGENLPKQVKVIVEDCGYTSVYAEFCYQLKRMYHLPNFPLINATSLITEIRAGYSFKEASAIKQVKKNKLPMLFIHGSEDTFVPTKMAYQLYDACQSEKAIFIVEGAGHGLSYTIDPEGYQKKVMGFIGKYIPLGD